MGLDYILPPPAPCEVLKSQMIYYTTGIFANKLEDAGFKCYGGENLSWYRVVNGELLQSVYFFSPYNFPLLVEIGYGMHPLYLAAPIPQKKYIPYGNINDSEIMWWLRDGNLGGKRIYEGTKINCLATPEMGAELLTDRLFPIFEENQTVDAAYEYFKTLYLGLSPYWTEESFMDQVIHRGDTDMYDWCLQRFRNSYDLVSGYKVRTKKDEQMLKRIKPKIDALETGSRDACIEALEMQKKKFIKKLETKLGIQF